MQTNDMPHKTIHQGRNVKRFREMLGIKQEALAFELGDEWSQKKVSLLESKETIDRALLQQLSGALKIPVEAFENFDEEQAVNIIANTFHDGSIANASTENLHCTFNPLDKVVELYERMLKERDEMIAELKKLIDLK